MARTLKALDVWLRFDSDEDEDPTHEANTFKVAGGWEIHWYHNDVGQVTAEHFHTLSDALAWYEANGYQDFSS